ncbi:arginine N-succinyltransferase [Psychrosphaera sp. B3R10]|uniref:arginine N-succinyltransferase n=1 Tax=unclassified Psychrosphaera TaxID=2641570 RepID=UPI001C08274C|nr:MULTISPECIES: arginine N-succinyltransferase [unclassified Psychrosphaera]MBU2881699.1 arginine N-succinyltransferase [Psychrosphaera sp. I2R16]MBU2991046.1 arginine N-succinyltransferase [Psychrosphaera sp. B3R10]
MLIVRPIQKTDFDGLKQIAINSGYGFTSLPVDDARLMEKIERAVNSINAPFTQRAEESYLFVLEDTETGKIVGTTGIEASVGLSVPLYHYRQSKIVHHSKQLGIYKSLDTLAVCNDYTGATEICTLFLEQAYRKTRAGRLLSKVRFMFMADHTERFSNTIIAEMRGVSDEQGNSPFWQWLQEHFFGIDFSMADHLIGLGNKGFISELMPKHPIYSSMLSPEAQAVIGRVHDKTKPALGLLTKEGFEPRGYVDLFDAGPTVEAKLPQIKSVKNSFLATVTICADDQLPTNIDPNAKTYGLSNLHVEQFRATFTQQIILHTEADQTMVLVSQSMADALAVQQGDSLRILVL